MKSNRKNHIFLKMLLFFMTAFVFASCDKKLDKLDIFRDKESTIPRESSYMYALVENGDMTATSVEERIGKNNEFVVNSKTMEEDILKYEITYRGAVFKVDVMLTEIEPPNYFRNIHQIKEAEYKKIIGTTNAVGTKMDFVGSNIDSYHFQLKLLNTIAPDLLAVVDYSSYNILAGKWVNMTAKSKIPPPPSYVSSIFLVNKDNTAWLYTLGLRRCGSMEMEIINSNKQYFNYHYNLLETLTERVVSREYLPKSKEPIYAGKDIILTWIPTEEALKDVKEGELASSKDRENEIYKNTLVIYSYVDEKAVEKKQVTPMSAINDIVKNRTLYYVSTQESQRMSALAKERWEYPMKALKNSKYKVQMKFAIPMDIVGVNKDSSEHMWFAVEKIKGEEVTGILLNEPYEVRTMKKGDKVKLKKSQLTDWIIYNENERIVPDMAYKLDE